MKVGCEAGARCCRTLLAGLISLVLLTGAPASSQEEAATGELPPAKHVLDVEVEKGDGEDRVAILVDGMIEPNVFAHQGAKNPMVIVDIPGTETLAKDKRIAVESPLLQSVRIGQHRSPTKVRVVLDLLNDVTYDVVKLDLYLGDPERLDEAPSRLVLTLRKAPP